MNNLILERSSTTSGMYNAEVKIDGVLFIASGFSWQDTIDRLLTKIVWFFHEK